MALKAIFDEQRSVRLADIMRPDYNSFGVIRLAMALAVMVSHSYFFATGQTSQEPLHRWTGHSLGEHAVQVFFFLSGILVTESLLRGRGMIDFATSRVLRIFPGLIVCVVLTALVLGPIVSGKPLAAYFGDPALPRYVLSTIALVTGSAPLPGVFEHLPAAGLVNMSLWTLKYEVLCYVGLAFTGAAGLLRERPLKYAAIGVAIAAMIVFLPAPSEAYTTGENIRYFALYFGTGTLAALLKEQVVISARLTIALFAVFVATLGTAWVELACALFLGSATLLVASWRFGPLRRWTNTYDLSFGIYIYAAPLQQALTQAIPGIGPTSLALAALVPVSILAMASWTCIEKPALGLRRQVGHALERLFSVPIQRIRLRG